MVKIKEMPMPKYMYYCKCPYDMTPSRIVIHNTANDASAKNEISYMQGNTNQTSYHYAVDDTVAILGSPLDRCTWHDGAGGNSKGNREGISIETCYSLSGGVRFEKAQENTAELTAYLLHEYGWGMDKTRITKHEDYSGKHCPHRTLDDYGWDYFLSLVEQKYNELYEGDLPMTSAERSEFDALKSKVAELESKHVRYEATADQAIPKWGYIDGNLPSWAAPTIKKLYSKDILKGDTNGNLQLSYVMLRILVMLDRTGIFG